MASDKYTIQLSIANKIYPVTASSENEEIYRKAAKLIQKKIDNYSSSFYAEDKQDYYAMVMLDLAVSLVSEQSLDEKLDVIVEKLDNALM